MADLIYPEDSYKIVGAAMSLFNELGFGYQEKYYYRGLLNKFVKLGYKVTRQLFTPLMADGKSIGRYYLDFLLEREGIKIVVEVKVADAIYLQHIKQVYGYLKANHIRLGLVLVISKNGILYKRVVN
jgi:GxxExxY protein